MNLHFAKIDFSGGYFSILLILVHSPSVSVMPPCLSEEMVSDNVPSMLYSSPCSLVYGMVPFLNAILGTMLPMLSMAKQDNMKWVFSSGKNLPDVHF